MSKYVNRTAVVASLVFLVLGFILGLGYRSMNLKNDESEDKVVYAIVDGKKILGENILPQIKNDLKQLEKNIYALKRKAVEDYIINLKDSSSAGQQTSAEARPKLDEIDYSKDEFTTYLKQRNIIVAKLSRQQQNDVLSNFKIHKAMLVKKVQDQNKMSAVNIEWRIPMKFLGPPAQVDGGKLPELQKGSGASIVLFANYHCPYCNQAFDKVKFFKEKYSGKVTLQFRFTMIDNAESIVYQSALATFCADEQGKFFDFFAKASEKPPLENADLIDIANQIQINTEKFASCLKSDKATQKLKYDLSAAEKLNILGVATAFVNGHPLEIQDTKSSFEEILFQ